MRNNAIDEHKIYTYTYNFGRMKVYLKHNFELTYTTIINVMPIVGGNENIIMMTYPKNGSSMNWQKRPIDIALQFFN